MFRRKTLEISESFKINVVAKYFKDTMLTMSVLKYKMNVSV